MPPPPRRSAETALKYQVVVNDNEYKNRAKATVWGGLATYS